MAFEKILIVEDEERMRRLIGDYLKREGFKIIEAEDGKRALESFESENVDLIILDIMLPEYDGWTVCREIRKSSKVPIIMLTARSEESDELFGFELGADEYVTKPFSPKILVARVNALLRRTNAIIEDIVSIEGIELDQIFIGSCTNGRFEDLKVVSEIIGDDKIDDGVRVIIIPASRTEYLKALNAGLIKRFVEAGAIVEFPSCGPCFGGSFGLLGDGEVGLSTSNRNFRGRQGSADAEIYLSSPAVAAASALKGVITDPRKI